MIGKFEMNMHHFYVIKNKTLTFVTETLNKMIRILINDHIIDYTKTSSERFEIILPLNPSSWDIAKNRVKKLIKRKIIGSEIDVIFDIIHLKEGSITNLRYRFFIINCFSNCFINIVNAYYNDNDTNVYKPYKLRLFFEKLWKIFQKRNESDFIILEHISNLVYSLI